MRSEAYSSLVDDVESLCIVKECRELEGRYGSNYTSKILSDSGTPVVEIENTIYRRDQVLQGDKVSQNHHDLRKLADTVGWKKLWDHCLDQGETCVASLVNLVRILSYPQHATRSCPLCESDSELQIVSLADHIISQHTSSSDSWNTLLNSLCELEPKCFTHLLCLYKLFKPS